MPTAARLYHLFTRVVPAHALATQDYLKLFSQGFMPLTVEVLHRRGSLLTLSVSHYYEQAGDLCADPDLELAVDLDAHTASPLAIQMPNYYVRAVSHDTQGRQVVHRQRVRELSAFAAQWFTNLRNQGFKYLLPPAVDPGETKTPADDTEGPA